jgi:hypothetical protein
MHITFCAQVNEKGGEVHFMVKERPKIYNKHFELKNEKFKSQGQKFKIGPKAKYIYIN